MHDDLGLYALGALEDPSDFERHLETCEECRVELEALRATMQLADDALADGLSRWAAFEIAEVRQAHEEPETLSLERAVVAITTR